MSSSSLADHLRPGDHVVVGQVTGEPRGLVQELINLPVGLAPIHVFCGFSLNAAWNNAIGNVIKVSSYCGLGTVGQLLARNELEITPCHLSQLQSHFGAGRLPADVVLLQVSPADADGYHSLGCTVDYVWYAAQVARVILVEVNPNVPRTKSPYRLHRDQVVEVGASTAPLLELWDSEPTDAQLRIGRRVADLIPNGATVQLGIGGVALAVARSLLDHRELRIRSGMVSDWVLELFDSGAVDTSEPGSCLTSIAVGSRKLYDIVGSSDTIGFVQPSQLTDPLDVVEGSPFMAVNSALEVDVFGQVNAEIAGQRYVGAVGGQVDYFRAARASAGGLSIVALPATTGRQGLSRIVRRIASGCVTSAQSDVDFVVTENGAVDIRATTLTRRRALISGIADARYRSALLSAG